MNLFLSCRPFHKNWQIYPDPGSKILTLRQYVRFTLNLTSCRCLSASRIQPGRMGLPSLQRLYGLILAVYPAPYVVASQTQAHQEMGLALFVQRWTFCYRLRYPALHPYRHCKHIPVHPRIAFVLTSLDLGSSKWCTARWFMGCPRDIRRCHHSQPADGLLNHQVMAGARLRLPSDFHAVDPETHKRYP